MRWLLLCLLLFALPARAQESPYATLVADSVQILNNSQILATGNVEVLYDTVRMEASRVLYDRTEDRVEIQGPITIVDGPSRVLLADAAELDGDLRNGLLRGARLVLDQQLQLAAAQINRVDGRLTHLYRTVASSCQVCGQNVPLWRIRATRVTHDEEARQLYFDNARLEVMGAPVFYLPRLRLPDPTLTRATGFLIPQIRSNSRLGIGVKIPYFVAMGDYSDLTVTPYISRNTRTLEARFRRAFSFGEVILEGAASDDELTNRQSRWYLFSTARFQLPRDFQLTLDSELVSDPAYLLDYNYSEKDRLDSGALLERTRRDELISANLVHFETLRASEIPIEDTLPTVVGDAVYLRRFIDPYFGGQSQLRLEAHTHTRDSTVDGDGRDVSRISARFDWRKSVTFGPGAILTGLGQFNADLYRIIEDSSFDQNVTHVTPVAGVELRWPLVRSKPGGTLQTLEPVAQVIWSEDAGARVPNEDSTFAEFDEGNLFALNRFPGSDAYERGLRFNLGARFTHEDARGRFFGVTAGRVVRATDLNQFAPGSGLEGVTSDWLVATQMDWRGMTLTNRALFDDRFDFTKNELRLGWTREKFDLSSTYFWSDGNTPINPDGTVGTTQARTSELALDASYQLQRHWTGRANWRYDFAADSAASAGLGLSYENECVALDLSLSRRFTSSTNVQPSTDVGLSVRLSGFGTGASNQAVRRSCGS